MTDKAAAPLPLWTRIAVIVSRIAVGATFVVSGFAKCIDPAGFIYKIEDYLTAWGLPGSHVFEVTAAFGLSVLEFTLGALVLLGCYRRVVPWILAAVMAFMLPLTLYIWIADPVADCGCFGEMIIISNAATFWKNVVLSALVVLLILYNARLAATIRPNFQWIAAAGSIAYAFEIGFIGYKYQPLVDFRPYPVGTRLAAADSGAAGEDEDENWKFEYEKDGETAVFALDSLPDDSWTFVRRLEEEKPEKAAAAGGLVLYNEAGEDVTATTIDADADQLLVLIPNTARIGYSRAHLIRSFNQAMQKAGGRMTAVVAGDDDFSWRDHVGQGLEVVEAEDTSIKELARGDIALVYLKSGIVQWKLDATSLPTDYLDSAPFSKAYPLGRLAMNSSKWLWGLTMLYLSVIVLLVTLPWLMIQLFIAKKRKKE